MLRTLASGVAVVAVCAAAGCASHDTPAAVSPLSVAGTWTQGASLVDAALGQSHIHSGSFSFTQHGESFAGVGEQTGLCQDAGGSHYVGPLANGTVFQITDGVQHGASVAFRSPLCSYEGTVSADGQHITGTASCAYTENGTQFEWTGDWLAHRGP